MENAEKLQEVSDEKPIQTTDDVQEITELNDENMEEVNQEPKEHIETESSPNIEPDLSIVKTELTTDSAGEGDTLKDEVVEPPKENEEEESQPKSPMSEASGLEDTLEEISDEEELEGGEEEHEEEEEHVDFSHADKKELLSAIRAVKNEDNIRQLDLVLKAIKPRFDELFEIEKNEALQRFVSEGNDADSFEFHSDEADKEFITSYGILKSRRNKHYKDLQNQREDNLKKKERILVQLREIVDGEESTQSINAVRELQTEWKNIGSVPGAQNKTLWANYNALLDRYYDARSIYFELKDLDRKKNLEKKTELCVKAEALNDLEDLKEAIVLLNDLHDEYKHLGPVPKENQEPLWERFKAASDAVYAKRKKYFEELKVQFEANRVEKEALIVEVEAFVSFSSDRITEWNEKTKSLLELQKKWEAIGGVPKEKAKEINKSFWNAFKKFFANKNQFFKQLEGHREENLARKQELISKAEELKESSEWDSVAQKLKNLQAEWKEIGPVPEKARKETYQRFKTACDQFFERRREQNKEKFKEFDENLTIKLQICDQLIKAGEEETPDLDDIYELIDNFTSVGFVPKGAIKKVQRRFDEAVSKVLSIEGLEDGDRADLKNHIEFGRLRNSPGGDRKVQRKENSIRRKISSLENDISTWNTNIEFFANSATADKLKADMQEKINEAERELAGLKSQLQSI